MDIKEWLERNGTYEEGLALFSQHSRKRQLVQHLSRKRDPAKLRYEMRKLSGIRYPSLSPKMPAPQPAEKLEKPHDRLRVLRDGSVRYDDLPEALQAEYQHACEAYKRMQSLHARLKAVTTDAERAAVRAELLQQDEIRAACWEKLDHWATDGTLPEAEAQPTPESASVAPTAVNTARVAIGRDLKNLDKADTPEKVEKYMTRLRENVEVIFSAGCKFGKNAARLAELGLIPPQTE